MITGKTQCLPLIGFPVEQVLSPPHVNRLFRELGIDAVMFPVALRPGELRSFIEALRGWSNAVGCAVTFPHKRAMFLAMDEATPRATMAGAVNIVRRDEDGGLIGDMTDGAATLHCLERRGIEIRGARVAIIGAGGGAGAAISQAVCAARAAGLALIEKDDAKGTRLAKDLSAAYPDVEIDTALPCDVDILINASPVGMDDDGRIPVDPEIIRRGGTVVDLVTKPPLTPLILAAHALDLTVVQGAEIVAAQAPLQFEHLRLAPRQDDCRE